MLLAHPYALSLATIMFPHMTLMPHGFNVIQSVTVHPLVLYVRHVVLVWMPVWNVIADYTATANA